MDHATLLARMDGNMQAMNRSRLRATPGGWIEDADGLVLCGAPGAALNLAMVTGTCTADRVRTVTDRLFRDRGQFFVVFTRGHLDDGLDAALPSFGFREVMSEPGMTLFPGEGHPGPLPPGLEIRPVASDAERGHFAELAAAAFAAFGFSPDAMRLHLALLESCCGENTQAFLCWHHGRPVSGAILYVSDDVGGVGWVSTPPPESRRGYGSFATWAVVHEAFRRGLGFVTLQASPMGAPVYQRMGFTTQTHYRLFVPCAP